MDWLDIEEIIENNAELLAGVHGVLPMDPTKDYASGYYHDFNVNARTFGRTPLLYLNPNA